MADTSLKEVLPDNNFGALPFLMSGGSEVTPRKHRALLKFDLSIIPTDAKITSASLVLELTGQPGNVNPPPASEFLLYRLLTPWAEGNKLSPTNCQSCQGLGAPAEAGEATWNDAFFEQMPWSGPGAQGNFVGQASVSEFIYGMNDSPYRFGPSPQLTGDVMLWHEQPETNFGWILISSGENTAFTARRFGSRESATPPILVVTFATPPKLYVALADREIALSFSTEAGIAYIIQSKSTVTDTWNDLHFVDGDGGLAEIFLPREKNTEFFRLLLP